MKLLEMFNRKQNDGTYVAIDFTDDTNKLLHDWANNLNLKNVNLIKPEEYHCTILYSRKEVKKEYHLNGIIRSVCKPIKLTVFPYEKNQYCLVLELENKTLCKLHQMLIDAGGTHDYDEFKPHVTICSGNKNDLNTNDISLPNFELVTNIIKTEKLDLNWASK